MRASFATTFVASSDDPHLFSQGTQYHLYEKLPSRRIKMQEPEETHFAVWGS